MKNLRGFIVAAGVAVLLGLMFHPDEEEPFRPGNWTLDTWWNYRDWRIYVNSQEWFKDGKWQVEANFDHAAHWEWQKAQIYASDVVTVR